MPVGAGARQAKAENSKPGVRYQDLSEMFRRVDVDESFVAVGVRLFVANFAVAVPIVVLITGILPVPRIAGRGPVMVRDTNRSRRPREGICSTGAHGEQDEGDANLADRLSPIHQNPQSSGTIGEAIQRQPGSRLPERDRTKTFSLPAETVEVPNRYRPGQL
jgi:hypothetical protein